MTPQMIWLVLMLTSIGNGVFFAGLSLLVQLAYQQDTSRVEQKEPELEKGREIDQDIKELERQIGRM